MHKAPSQTHSEPLSSVSTHSHQVLFPADQRQLPPPDGLPRAFARAELFAKLLPHTPLAKSFRKRMARFPFWQLLLGLGAFRPRQHAPELLQWLHAPRSGGDDWSAQCGSLHSMSDRESLQFHW